jgi:hypothetical protein
MLWAYCKSAYSSARRNWKSLDTDGGAGAIRIGQHSQVVLLTFHGSRCRVGRLSSHDATGVIFPMNVDSVDEAKAEPDTLPPVTGGFAQYEFIPVGPLAPLGRQIQGKQASTPPLPGKRSSRSLLDCVPVRSAFLGTQRRKISGLELKRVRPRDRPFRSGSGQNAVQELIEKLELSRVRSPRLEVEYILEHPARQVETLKSMGNANLEDDAIAIVRHRCPTEYLATHGAPRGS